MKFLIGLVLLLVACTTSPDVAPDPQTIDKGQLATDPYLAAMLFAAQQDQELTVARILKDQDVYVAVLQDSDNAVSIRLIERNGLWITDGAPEAVDPTYAWPQF